MMESMALRVWDTSLDEIHHLEGMGNVALMESKAMKVRQKRLDGIQGHKGMLGSLMESMALRVGKSYIMESMIMKQ